MLQHEKHATGKNVQHEKNAQKVQHENIATHKMVRHETNTPRKNFTMKIL